MQRDGTRVKQLQKPPKCNFISKYCHHYPPSYSYHHHYATECHVCVRQVTWKQVLLLHLTLGKNTNRQKAKQKAMLPWWRMCCVWALMGKREQDRGVGETDYSPCIAHLSLSPTPHASECRFLYSEKEKRKNRSKNVTECIFIISCKSTAKCMKENLMLNETRCMILSSYIQTGELEPV